MLTKYLLLLTFLAGFISELGGTGTNFAILLFELSFVITCHFSRSKNTQVSFASLARSPLYYCVLAWLIWSTLSLLIALPSYSAVHGTLSLLRQLEYISHIIFVYYLISFFNTQKDIPNSLLLMIPLTALLTGLNLIFAWVTYPEIHHPLLWLDTAPFYMNIRQAGFHCTAAIFVLLPMIQHARSWRSIIPLSTLLIISISFLFWSGSRGPALAAYLTIVLWLLFLLLNKKPLKRLIVVTVCCSVLAVFLSEQLSVMPWNGIVAATERSVEAVSVERLSSGRLNLWLFAWEHARSNLVFGSGAESYFLAKNTPIGFQPHNSILQFLMNWGVPGLVASFSILLIAFLKGWFAFFQASKSNSEQAFQSTGGLIIIAFMATSLVDGTLYHGQASYYLAIAYALWLSSGLMHGTPRAINTNTSQSR